MELDNRMISAEWLKNRCYEICDEYNTEHLYIDRIIDEIDNAPDLEVVRCKDCKWYRIAQPDNVPYCCHESGYCGEYMGGLFYCACGERKDNG